MMADQNFLSLNSESVQPVGKESPNMILFNKMEQIVSRMRSSEKGVQIKTVKSLLTKIPDVFSGEDLVTWLSDNVEITELNEAIHLGSLIAAHGYFFPIDDHVITLKNDNSFYRFQSEHYWPSNGWDPDSMEYAIYLCKRTMQNKARLELADYEAENLARLQKTYAKNWEDIFARAEIEARTDKKREKIDRKVHDSQERAFWDVYRPVPGCVNTFELDIKKAYSYRNKSKKSVYTSSPRKFGGKSLPTTPVKAESAESLKLTIQSLSRQLDRHCLKMSKVCESIINYTDQQYGYDPMITAIEPSNPWITGEDQFWTETRNKEITPRRATRWKFSFTELLKDEVGRDEFRKFLEKEISAENLYFYLACKQLKQQPNKMVRDFVKKIYQKFLSDEAPNPINIDSRIKEATIKNMETPDRYCFEKAQDHIYHLMKSDSYARFIKSDRYKSCLSPKQKQSARSRNIPSMHSEPSSTMD